MPGIIRSHKLLGLSLGACAALLLLGHLLSGTRDSDALEFLDTASGPEEPGNAQGSNAPGLVQQPGPDQGAPRRTVETGFRIRVIDTYGRPIPGVPILLSTPKSKSYLGQSSGPEGVLELPLREVEAIVPARLRPAARVHVHIPGYLGPGVALDLDNPPDDIVVLELPAIGAISLVIRNPWGEPAGGGENLELELLSTESRKGLARRLAGDWIGAERSVGIVRYPYVALGRRFQVWMNRSNESQATAFTGPVVAGEEIKVNLGMADDRPSLVGKARASDGKPLVNGTLELSYSWKGGSMKTEISTDQKGRFHFHFPRALIGERLNRLDLELLDQDEQATGMLARIRQFEELGRRPWNLGTVSLALAPLIVKGRVLLDGKAPRQVQLTSRQLAVWSEGPDGQERQVLGISFRDLAGGAFAVRGFPPRSALLLKLNFPRLKSQPAIPFLAGEDGLTIELSTGASLELRVLCDDLIPNSAWRACLQALGSPIGAARIGKFRSQGQDAGVFTWHGLKHGTYRLDLLGDSSIPALRIPKIVIHPGHQTHPGILDLRGKLKHAKIVVRSSGPRAPIISEGTALLIEGSRSGLLRGRKLRNGAVNFYTPQGPLDLMIAAPGFENKRASIGYGEQKVFLNRARLANFQIERDATLSADITALVRIKPSGLEPWMKGRYGTRHGLGQVLDLLSLTEHTLIPDSRGRAALSLPHPGGYRLRVDLIPRPGQGDKSQGRIQPESIDPLRQSDREVIPVMISPSK